MIVTATEAVRGVLGGERFPRLESPSLRLEKFVRLEHGTKKNEIDAVVRCHNRHAADAEVAAVPHEIPGARVVFMKLQYRLIVNQAGGILENAGLCLHRHFGFPYIPGSAVKGAARHAAWCRWHDENDPDSARKIALTFGYPTGDPRLDHSLAAGSPELYGEQGRFRMVAGAVAFLPALPAGKVRLVIDIVNCHHREYYSGKARRATDDESPNPQFFPAVDQGTLFRFVLLPVRRRTDRVEAEFGFDPVGFAEESLREACEEDGLGAKTAAGYGWFEPDPEALKQWEERQRREREKEKREHDERRRRENLSPEERAAEDYEVEVLQKSGDAIAALKGKMRQIAGLPESEQRHICTLLRTEYKTLWAADAKQAEKVAGNEKKRKKDKAFARVRAVREAAAKLGEELP